MMLIDRLTAFRTATGIPVAYRFFREAQSAPFVVYYETATNPWAADNSNYYPTVDMTVELYTDVKSPSTETSLESYLTDYVWSKTETYIDSEQLYMITYSLEE